LGDGKAADWPLIAETLLLCDYPGLAAAVYQPVRMAMKGRGKLRNTSQSTKRFRSIRFLRLK
jgi:hypothetical protein